MRGEVGRRGRSSCRGLLPFYHLPLEVSCVSGRLFFSLPFVSFCSVYWLLLPVCNGCVLCLKEMGRERMREIGFYSEAGAVGAAIERVNEEGFSVCSFMTKIPLLNFVYGNYNPLMKIREGIDFFYFFCFSLERLFW